MRQSIFAGKGSAKYPAGDSRSWKLGEARKRVRTDRTWKNRGQAFAYRPFDTRALYYVPWIVDWPRPQVMHHMLAGENIGLHVCRQIVSDTWQHALVTSGLTDDSYVSNKSRERGYLFPLYLYSNDENSIVGGNQASLTEMVEETNVAHKRPNLRHEFIRQLEQHLPLGYIDDGQGDLRRTFGPEDVFHYIYAVFQSVSYRKRYIELLRIDFPRIPITGDATLFGELCTRGALLVDLHLLRLPGTRGVGGSGGAQVLVSPETRGVDFPIGGNNLVENIQYVDSHGSQRGYVTINNEQRFTSIDLDIGETQIGGYQPLLKWLKDRKGRILTQEDIAHYKRIVIALSETTRLRGEIDDVIEEHGGWPLVGSVVSTSDDV